MSKRQKGFALIELVVVIAVVAILVAVAVPLFAEQVAKAEKSAFIQNGTLRYKEMLILTIDHHDSYYTKNEKYMIFDAGGKSEYLGKYNGTSFEDDDSVVLSGNVVTKQNKSYYNIEDIIKGVKNPDDEGPKDEDKPGGEKPPPVVESIKIKLNFAALKFVKEELEESVLEAQNEQELSFKVEEALPVAPSEKSYRYCWYKDAGCTVEYKGESLANGSTLYAGFITKQEYFAIMVSGMLKEVTAADDVLVIPNSINGTVVTGLDSHLFQSETSKYYRYIRILPPISELSASQFKNNLRLEDIELPDSIIKIGNLAFAGCTALKKIRLKAGIEIMGSNVFKDCSGLTIFADYKARPSKWDPNWDAGLGSDCTQVWLT